MEFAEAIRSAWQADHKEPAIQRWIKKLLSFVAPAMQKIGGARRSRTLIVEERISLGPKKSLMLISCRGESFLVASGAEEVSSVLPLRTRQRTTSPSGKRRVIRARGRRS